MRVLGDEYIKAEFRAHRKIDNPAHLVRALLETEHSRERWRCWMWRQIWYEWDWLLLQIGFLTEWQLYAQKIEGDNWAGEKIDEGKLAKMSGTFTFESSGFGLRD
jgi:hypothetical protein